MYVRYSAKFYQNSATPPLDLSFSKLNHEFSIFNDLDFFLSTPHLCPCFHSCCVSGCTWRSRPGWGYRASSGLLASCRILTARRSIRSQFKREGPIWSQFTKEGPIRSQFTREGPIRSYLQSGPIRSQAKGQPEDFLKLNSKLQSSKSDHSLQANQIYALWKNGPIHIVKKAIGFVLW